MRGRWLLNLALAAFAAVLAWLLIQRPGIAPAPVTAKLSARDPAAVQAIRIERAGAPAMELTRTSDDGWRLAAPLAARADPHRAQGLARILAATTSARFAADAAALADYGLAAPEVTLDFDGARLALGSPHPLGGQRYVLLDGAVHLLAETDLRFVPATAEDLLDPRLFAPGARPVALELPGFRLEKGEKAWRLDPATEQPSQDRLLAFVDEWRLARALAVAPASGQQPPSSVTVVLEDANGARARRTVGVLAHSPELVLVREDEGLQYRFPASLGARLLAPPATPGAAAPGTAPAAKPGA